MDIDIEKLIKAAAGGLDLSNFKGDVVGFKYVENEIGTVAEGATGVQKIYYSAPPSPEQDTCAFTPKDKRGPKFQFLFVDKNGDEDLKRTATEKDRFLRYLHDYQMDSLQLSSSKRDKLIKVVICFCKKWVENKITSPSLSPTAIVRFMTETCEIDRKANRVTIGNVIGQKLTAGEYDEDIYTSVCEYF
ncbi:MAG: hypothetical protein IKG86_01585 [Paludibacteraceae bacterium]|nr:hypothetical protein [Paludibacteraceae bacterium]